MFSSFASWLHGVRRRLSRSEWAIRHLRLPVSENTAEEPGLLLIQIDGLPRTELENAMKEGRMPFLAGLRQRSNYGLTTFYPGVPSTTPAVQAELFYGVHAGVPAFSFQNRATGKIVSMFDPELAKEFEADFSARGEPLLEGGSSWSNIYSGGASPEECHFCISTFGLPNWIHGGHFFAKILFSLLHLPSLIRIVALLVLEFLLGLGDAVWGLFKGQTITLEVGAVLSRMSVGVAVRELLVIGGRLDLARGLPIIHLNFLGYDELSHCRGPKSGYAHWSLRGIDSAIADLYRAAHRSRRRDYQVWIFSDHGQDRTRSFEGEFPGRIRQVVADCLSSTPGVPAANPFPSRPASRWLFDKEKHHRENNKGHEEEFSIASLGPVGHLYLPAPLTNDQRHALARRLVGQGKIPAVVHLCQDGTVVWHDAEGSALVPDELMDRLTSYRPSLRQEMVNDLVQLARNENAGDLILLGHNGKGECWTFAQERGSHGGLGPEESRGFLLTPPATSLPEGSDDFVRPEGLRAAVFHLLGKKSLDPVASNHSLSTHLKVMSYNVHSCSGMDGRISPRRIARTIAQENPDIVALQELDSGRSRSRGEDQANMIASVLGYHVVFCPTVTDGGECYGHAVLSRWPLETVKVAGLPSHPGGLWPEKRGALWTCLNFHGVRIHVVTTHLGLASAERQAQMRALLGNDWLGPVMPEEPVILCGDFNCRPGGATHRLATAFLRDVAGPRGFSTFSSLQPMVRLDHIFVSRHFRTENARVVDNHLTRVSSDHLPLFAELTMTITEKTGDPTLAEQEIKGS